MQAQEMICITKEKLEEYENASTIYNTVIKFMTYARQGCYSDKYGCIASNKIPVDGNLTEQNTWLDDYFNLSLTCF